MAMVREDFQPVRRGRAYPTNLNQVEEKDRSAESETRRHDGSATQSDSSTGKPTSK
jgi:hypothetical protein